VSASKWAPSRDYEIGTTIHKQLQAHILDDYQVIDDFDRELSSHKLTRKEYDEHYKRICAAKERFYAAKELNHKEHHNDTREREYDKRDTKKRDTRERRNDDRRSDTRERESYDRRSDTRERESYDRRSDSRERRNDRRSDSRERRNDRRSDSRERRNDRRCDSREREKNNIEIAPTLNVTPSVPLTNQIIPKKRFNLQVKKKPEQSKTKVNAAVSLEIKEVKVLELEDGELEEGELEETELSNSNDIMTEERKELLKDLYGDLNC
jgi:hypothetical protein